MLVASEGEHTLVPGSDGGLRADFQNPATFIQKVVRAHRDRPIAAVVATDDATVEIANQAAAALGLAHNAPLAPRIARRKDLSRTTLAAAGLPVPETHLVDLRLPLGPQLTAVTFPCVSKPLAMSASRGVIRADDARGLEDACRRAGMIAAAAGAEEPDAVLVESFVPGPEIALEGMLSDGELS
ncbi:MAG: ATP-grasp domain-containing protein, partial [Gammaproteobacteria bacterium]|nr:ATP-grasp domain-containing protein [Gammaproteobacteria bacterium]